MRVFCTTFLIALSASLASAQNDGTSSGEASEVVAHRRAQLPAGTPIVLQMTQTVTTQGDSWAEDDQFNMALSEDVLLGGHVVIPKGTLAFGHVRWTTGRGVFGKSGKIEVEVDYLLLGDKQIKLAGVYREEGRGSLTSIGSVVAAGPLAGFITGESGEIARGAILTAQLAENIRVIIPESAPTPPTAGPAMSMVRARQISISEAFSDTSEPAGEPPTQEVEARRITVAEAFEDELTALDDEQ